MKTEKNDGKRLVFKAGAETHLALEDTSGKLELSKIGTIQLAVKVLATIANTIAKGGKIVLRDKEGAEREVWLPMIGSESLQSVDEDRKASGKERSRKE
jgi:hypothetical protein